MDRLECYTLGSEQYTTLHASDERKVKILFDIKLLMYLADNMAGWVKTDLVSQAKCGTLLSSGLSFGVKLELQLSLVFVCTMAPCFQG